MDVAELKAKRETHGISVEQLASDLGYSRQALWRWERGAGVHGARKPHRAILTAWEMALDERIQQAMWGADDDADRAEVYAENGGD